MFGQSREITIPNLAWTTSLAGTMVAAVNNIIYFGATTDAWCFIVALEESSLDECILGAKTAFPLGV
jgi:hypothetical protein